MVKRLSALLSVLLPLGALAATFSGGDGTQENPYLIGTKADLADLADLVTSGDNFEGKYLRQTADLTFSSSDTFKPIGKMGTAAADKKPFAGHFDGNGHSISGFTLNGARYQSLFPALSAGGSIKNLTVKNAKIITSDSYAGMIAGLGSGDIDNCHAVDCTMESTGTGGFKGLIVGQADGTLSRCTSSGSITTFSSAGGIVGQLYTNAVDCHSSATLINQSTAMSGSTTAHIGGIAGVVTVMGGSHSIEGCSFTGSINGGYNGYAGGIAGTFRGSDVKDCWTAAYISGTGSSSACGGIVANLEQGTLTDCFVASTLYNLESKAVGGAAGMQSKSYSSALENIIVYASIYSSVLAQNEGSEFVGQNNDNKATVTNCVFDKQVSWNGSSANGLTTAGLTSGTALPGFSTEKWDFTAGKYPRLRSALASDAATLYAIPIYYADGERQQAVTSDFTLGQDADVEWNLPDSEFASLEGNTVKITRGPRLETVILTGYLGDCVRRVRANIYPVIFQGLGTAENPYLISGLEDWKKLVDAVNNQGLGFSGEYFRLTADIDMDGVQIDPIGLKDPDIFGGTLDGDGHSILNFAVDNVESKTLNLALFGILAPSATVKNLTIEATSHLNIYRNFAPFCYTVYGTLENCVNKASFSCTDGFCAGFSFYLYPGGTIRNCVNFGDITSPDSNKNGQLGGFVVNNNGGTIEDCVNFGNIGSPNISATNVGGIAGSNYGVITRTANYGTIQGAKNVGGIAGQGGTNSSYGSSNISYTIGAGPVVSNAAYDVVGATVGAISGSPVFGEANVYDSQIAIYSGALSQAQSAGYSTAELANLANGGEGTPRHPCTIEGWEYLPGVYPLPASIARDERARFFAQAFMAADGEKRTELTGSLTLPTVVSDVEWSLSGSNVFTLNGNLVNVGESRAYASAVVTGKKTLGTSLLSRSLTVATLGNPFEGAGTEADPYIIAKAADMVTLGNAITAGNLTYAGKYFSVTADLDFTGITPEGAVAAGANDSKFEGIVAGNNHTVKNLVINSSAGSVGLFGRIGAGGSVSDLTIDSSVKITGAGTVGSVAGSCDGVLKNISSAACVSSTKANAGGIVGSVAKGASILDCSNSGPVTNTDNYTGGIVGNAAATAVTDITISGCSNSGTISGKQRTAGIAGNAKGATIENCANKGDVTGTGDYTAGIAGNADATSISGSCNEASITGTSNAGGIIGYCTKTCKLDRSFNSGEIKGTKNNIAGLAGRGDAMTISRCYNTGAVSTTGTISASQGGAAGLVANGVPAISDCWNSGDITASNGAAGLVAYPSSTYTAFSIVNSYNTGAVNANEGSENVGAIMGKATTKLTAANVWFDTELHPGQKAMANGDLDGAAGCKTSELIAADLGDNWVNAAATYPVLVGTAGEPAAAVASATIAFAGEDTYDNVTSAFTVGTEGGVVWSGEAFKIEGANVAPINSEIGVFPLTVSKDGHSKIFSLNLTKTSGLGDVAADGYGVAVVDGALVISVPYTLYDTAGRTVAAGNGAATLRLPQGVYVIRTAAGVAKVLMK